MTKPTTGRLAEEIDRNRTAAEALDTLVAAFLMLNGEITTPAPLTHQRIRHDLRSALLTLHIALGPGLTQAAPNLREALVRAKRLGDVLEGSSSVGAIVLPSTLPPLDKSIQTVRDLIAADKDRRGELTAEIKTLDEATPALDAAAADFEEMEKRPAGGGAGAIAIALVIVGLLVGIAGYVLGVIGGS